MPGIFVCHDALEGRFLDLIRDVDENHKGSCKSADGKVDIETPVKMLARVERCMLVRYMPSPCAVLGKSAPNQGSNNKSKLTKSHADTRHF